MENWILVGDIWHLETQIYTYTVTETPKGYVARASHSRGSSPIQGNDGDIYHETEDEAKATAEAHLKAHPRR